MSIENLLCLACEKPELMTPFEFFSKNDMTFEKILDHLTESNNEDI